MKHDPTKYAYASPLGSADDVASQVAQGIQIGPASLENAESGGVAIARPHATGWFVSAYHRPGLTAEQMSRLQESVTGHVFTLLTQGISPDVWTRSASGGAWHLDISATAARESAPVDRKVA